MRYISLSFALLAVSARAAQYDLELKPENTKIAWTLGDILHTVHGTFILKNANIRFDSETGEASGQAVVDLTSGNSGNNGRDRKMHTDVLESAKFPEAVFTPDRFEGKLTLPGTSVLKLHGSLRIYGASHETTMDITAKCTADRMNADIAFDIPYVAWGMKDPSNFLLKVEKAVHISITSSANLTRR